MSSLDTNHAGTGLRSKDHYNYLWNGMSTPDKSGDNTLLSLSSPEKKYILMHVKKLVKMFTTP